MKKLNPEKFLDSQALSALENESIKGGNASETELTIEKKKEKRK